MEEVVNVAWKVVKRTQKRGGFACLTMIHHECLLGCNNKRIGVAQSTAENFLPVRPQDVVMDYVTILFQIYVLDVFRLFLV